MSQARPVVAVLGDSRVFDTYYVTDVYRERYGYNSTFPFLLSQQARDESADFDVVHIPDHFRGGTVENNIIRLALNDPSVVVLCDGIWESLVGKKLFEQWAAENSSNQPYDSRILADLFTRNELPISPNGYAAKQRRIVSYFRRRRRQCVWMSLPMPPRDHLDRFHYAGSYQCIPEWDECLGAINDAMTPIVSGYRAIWFDLHSLVNVVGGFGRALIDQWHFSKRFHKLIADELGALLRTVELTLAQDHISREFLLARRIEAEPVILIGTDSALANWRSTNPRANVRQIVRVENVSAGGSDVKVASMSEAKCVVLVNGPEASVEFEADLLARLPSEKVVLYPDELGSIDNPVGFDRAQHGALR